MDSRSSRGCPLFLGPKLKLDGLEKPICVAAIRAVTAHSTAKFSGFCGFLRESGIACGFLRRSVPPKCRNFEEKRKSARISEHLRKRLRIWACLSLQLPLIPCSQ